MSEEKNYWNKVMTRRTSRRRALAATGGFAAAAAFLAACGGDDDEEEPSTTTQTDTTGQTLDPTKGKRGGKFVWQGYGDIGGSLDLIKFGDYSLRQFSGLTHDALLETRSGTPGVDGTDKSVQPLLAVALPEVSPDKLKYT